MWDIKKGDVVKVGGKLAIVDSDVIERAEFDDETRTSGTVFSSVSVIFPDTGIKWTVKLPHIERVGREFP